MGSSGNKTVVRGGFGLAFDRYRSDVNGNGAANPPYVFNPALNFGYLQEIRAEGVARFSFLNLRRRPDWRLGRCVQFHISVQRELWTDTVLDVGYVGTQARHLPRTSNLNAISYAATFWGQRRTRRGMPTV